MSTTPEDERGMGSVIAVSASSTHSLSKSSRDGIRLIAGIGVEGDVHAGATVKHRSRVAANPSQPNLRQVHLIHEELHEELATAGFIVRPGEMGENITTRGVSLLDLPVGTLLHLGSDAQVAITGVRNPCTQLDRFQPGLMAAVLDRDAEGNLVRKAGIMAVVRIGGVVRPGDSIRIELPSLPHVKLSPV